MLARNKKVYERRNEHLSYYDMQNLLPSMKEYLPWLKESDSQALKYACRQVNKAFDGFLKRKLIFQNSTANERADSLIRLQAKLLLTTILMKEK